MQGYTYVKKESEGGEIKGFHPLSCIFNYFCSLRSFCCTCKHSPFSSILKKKSKSSLIVRSLLLQIHHLCPFSSYQSFWDRSGHSGSVNFYLPFSSHPSPSGPLACMLLKLPSCLSVNGEETRWPPTSLGGHCRVLAIPPFWGSPGFSLRVTTFPPSFFYMLSGWPHQPIYFTDLFSDVPQIWMSIRTFFPSFRHHVTLPLGFQTEYV